MTNISLKTLALPVFLSLTVVIPAKAQLYRGDTLEIVQPAIFFDQVKPGSIVILGESHGLQSHSDQHQQVLNGLREKGLKVSVGLEFLNYTDQTFVDQYLNKQIDDEMFLKSVNWQGFDFKFYKNSILFPNAFLGESTIGLNIPRAVTSKIAKTGLESLSADDLKLMPPNFHVGRDSYRQRFSDIIHVPVGPVLDRYFTAQSVWDDTMAWTATQFIASHPEQVLVIVVGEFHAQYGGGLADRILARAPNTPIVTLSQIWAANRAEDGTLSPISDEEVKKEIKPSDVYGKRGDYIWVSKPN